MAKRDDPFSMFELLIGLPNVKVLSVDRVDGVLEIHLESAEPVRFCPLHGVAGVVKDRPVSMYEPSALHVNSSTCGEITNESKQ